MIDQIALLVSRFHYLIIPLPSEQLKEASKVYHKLGSRLPTRCLFLNKIKSPPRTAYVLSYELLLYDDTFIVNCLLLMK